MVIAEKLNILFGITNESNSRLAKELHVDPSLISRWRNGTRNIPSSEDIIFSISAFFSKKITEPNQIHIMKHLINIDSGIIVDAGNIERDISNWLLAGTITADELIQYSQSHIKTTVPQSESPELLGENVLISADYSTGIGDKGRIDAIKKMMVVAKKKQASGKTIVVYFNEHPKWMEKVNLCITPFLMQNKSLIKMIDQFIIVLPEDIDPESILTITNFFVPYLNTALLQIYGVKVPTNSTCHQYVALISGIGAVVSVNYFGGEPVSSFISDGQYVKTLHQDLLSMGMRGKPMVERYDHLPLKRIYEMRSEVLTKEGDVYSYGNAGLFALMPEEVLSELLGERLGYYGDMAEMSQKESFFYDNLKKNLESNKMLACMPLYTPEEIRKGNFDQMTIPHVSEDDLIINEHKYLLILKHMHWLMEQYPNFTFQVVGKLSHNYNIWVKEGCCVHLTSNGFDPVMYYSEVESILQAQLYGIRSRYMKIPPEKRTREYNMNELEKQIKQFERQI